MSEPEKLSATDADLLRNVIRAKQEAEATHRFIAQHLGSVYHLADGCAVDLTTGLIMRPEASRKTE